MAAPRKKKGTSVPRVRFREVPPTTTLPANTPWRLKLTFTPAPFSLGFEVFRESGSGLVEHPRIPVSIMAVLRTEHIKVHDLIRNLGAYQLLINPLWSYERSVVCLGTIEPGQLAIYAQCLLEALNTEFSRQGLRVAIVLKGGVPEVQQ